MFNFLKKWTNPGLYLPHAVDTTSGKPSATLFFAYGSFFLATGAVVYLVVKDPTEGAIAAITTAVLYSVLYKMRQVDKLKFSKEGVEIDAEDGQDENVK
jgi:hypothetical protein